MEAIRPDHYEQASIDCKTAMELAYGPEDTAKYFLINAFKYLWRYKYKNGKEDLVKGLTCVVLAREITYRCDDEAYKEINKKLDNVNAAITAHLKRLGE